MTMEKTSFSELKTVRRCKRAHRYRYHDRLRRRRPNRPALIGTILHEMLDARVKRQLGNKETGPKAIFKKYKKFWEKLFTGEKEEFGDVPAVVQAVYDGYLRRWRRDGMIYIASEVQIEVQLTKKIVFQGIIDKVLEDADGRRFLMDHKFHKVIPGPDHRFSDIQTVLYFWAWNETHSKAEQVDGIIWDYGRMKAPAIPEVLKNGELTRRANIDTDQFTYRAAIEEHGLSHKPYREILKSLEGKERTFFERVTLPAPPRVVVREVVQDAKDSAIEAKRALRTGVAPRSQSGFNCNGCEFRTLCEAELRGFDTKSLRKREYENRDEEKESKYGEIEEAA